MKWNRIEWNAIKQNTMEWKGREQKRMELNNNMYKIFYKENIQICLPPDNQIRYAAMISEGSHDTEDWRNDAEKCNVTSQK